LFLYCQGFDVNSAYSSVDCSHGISIHGSFSGPAGFNSNPVGMGRRDGVSGVGEIDGTGKSIKLMISPLSVGGGLWVGGLKSSLREGKVMKISKTFVSSSLKK